jgi:hypothetical protein
MFDKQDDKKNFTKAVELKYYLSGEAWVVQMKTK